MIPIPVVDALAAARLTRLVTSDTLPIVARPRRAVTAWVLRRHPEIRPGSLHSASPALVELIHCDWCASWHIVVGVLLARRYAPRWWDPISKALATAFVAGWLSHQSSS